MARPLVLLLLAFAAAGCAGAPLMAPELARDPSCGADPARFSASATLAPPYVGEPVDVAARLGEALGDPLQTRATDPRDETPTWPTREGSLAWRREEAGPLRDAAPHLEWLPREPPTFYPTDEQGWLLGVLKRFGVPDGIPLDLATDKTPEGTRVVFAQLVGDEHLHGTGGYLETAPTPGLVLGPLYVVPNNVTLLTGPEARAAAATYLACTGGGDVPPDAPWSLDVRDASLVILICTPQHAVLVDAVTGAPHGSMPTPC